MNIAGHVYSLKTRFVVQAVNGNKAAHTFYSIFPVGEVQFISALDVTPVSEARCGRVVTKFGHYDAGESVLCAEHREGHKRFISVTQKYEVDEAIRVIGNLADPNIGL